MQSPIYQNEGATALGSGGDAAPMVTIDMLDISDLSLLKIDVECFEDRVLKGAMKTIKKNRPIILLEILKNRGELSPEKRAQRVLNIFTLLQNVDYSLRHITGDDYMAFPKELALEFNHLEVCADLLTLNKDA